MSKIKTIQICVGIGMDQLTPEYVTIEIPRGNISSRKLTWEEQVQWVMRNTNVPLENLYIVEEVYKDTTPTHLVTTQIGEETIQTYE
jgi:hypothetical protein